MRVVESAPEKKYIFCNYCKSDTNHLLKGDHYRESYDSYDNYWQLSGCRLWICAGCENGTMEEYYTSDGSVDERGNQIYQRTYFPPRNFGHIRPKSFLQLPDKLSIIYGETLQTYNARLFVLCAIGLRALLEGICADQRITGRNLEERIEGLSRVLPGNIVSSLHSLRFIGNTAAHELASPKRTELRLGIEICEDLLNFLYELDYKASRLNAEYKRNTEIPETGSP